MVSYTVRITKAILQQSMYCGYKNEDDYEDECAIKLALSEDFSEAIVSSNRLYLDEDACEFGSYIDLPLNVIHFIKAFDTNTPEERLKMNEFDFTVQIPDEIFSASSVEMELV